MPSFPIARHLFRPCCPAFTKQLPELLCRLLIDGDMDDDGENVHPVQDSDAVQPDIQQGVGALQEDIEKQVNSWASGLGGVRGALCSGAQGCEGGRNLDRAELGEHRESAVGLTGW